MINTDCITIQAQAKLQFVLDYEVTEHLINDLSDLTRNTNNLKKPIKISVAEKKPAFR